MHWHYRPVWLRSAPVREEPWFILATLWKKRSSFTAFSKNRYSNTCYRPLYPWLCISFFLSTHLYWPINIIGSVYFCFIGFEDDLSGRLGALSRSLLNWKTNRCWIKPLVCRFTLKHESNVFVSYIVIPVMLCVSERVLKLIHSSSGRFQDFPSHSDSVHVCSFSWSGSQLFTAAHNELLLWTVHGL